MPYLFLGALAADGGLFMIKPQFGAMGALAILMGLFIASFFRRKEK